MHINLEQHTKDIPPLQDSVMSALGILAKDDVDFHCLENTINSDPALVGLVLKLANTPFYGMQKEVASIREANIILGVHTLRNILVTAGVTARFPETDGTLLDRKALWAHMRGVAVCAQVFARRLGVDVGKAFTAGLLHDVGKLVLDCHYENELAEILAVRDKNNCLFREAEEEILGINHADIGAIIAKSWRLPDDVVSAIENHHDVERGGVSMLACIVQAADMSARALKLGNGGDNLIPPLEKKVTDMLGWDNLGIKDISTEIHEMYEEFSNIFS